MAQLLTADGRKASTQPCPRCGAQLLDAEHADQVCMACGYEEGAEPTAPLYAEIARVTGVELEPCALETLPPARGGQPRTIYDQLVRLLLAAQKQGECLRFPLKRTGRQLNNYRAFRAALDRAGQPTLSVQALDRGGYRYLRLTERRQRARPGQAKH